MNVIQEFKTSVFLCFSELNDSIKDTILQKLSEEAIHENMFKIEKVIDFTVIDIPVLNNGVLVNLNVKAETIYPKIGFEYTFKEWKINGDNIIIYKPGVQVLAKIGNANLGEGNITIRIEKVKQIVDTLVCVGTCL